MTKDKKELNDEELENVSDGKTAPEEHEESSCYNNNNVCGDCSSCYFSLSCTNSNKTL